jgi:DNA-binding transcriptional ArsR family regulator
MLTHWETTLTSDSLVRKLKTFSFETLVDRSLFLSGHDQKGPPARNRRVLLTYNHMVVDTELTQSEIDCLFQALSDATRRDILRRTVEHGDSVSVLARRYSMSFAAVQKHVMVLERAALVTKERRGREQIVHANGATLCRAASLLDAYEQLWIHRVEQIEEILEAEEREKV